MLCWPLIQFGAAAHKAAHCLDSRRWLTGAAELRLEIQRIVVAVRNVGVDRSMIGRDEPVPRAHSRNYNTPACAALCADVKAGLGLCPSLWRPRPDAARHG